jgi:nitroreductase
MGEFRNTRGYCSGYPLHEFKGGTAMDLIELIKQRRSIRHFKPDKPSREVILQCLEAASWAPNPTSQQPWKFIVLAGDPLKSVCKAIQDNFAAAAAEKAQQPEPVLDDNIAELLQKRKQESFGGMISFLKENNVDMQAAGEGNFNFHSAPVGILFAVYPCKDQNFLKSTVAAMENFLLAAAARGLGTCWMNAVSICQEDIKEALDLSADLILVDGVSVGYPAEGSPMNQVPRSRLPIEEVTEWRE